MVHDSGLDSKNVLVPYFILLPNKNPIRISDILAKTSIGLMNCNSMQPRNSNR